MTSAMTSTIYTKQEVSFYKSAWPWLAYVSHIVNSE